jgi:putative ABC transport system permease protein
MKASMDTKRRSQWVMDFVIFLIVGLGVFNAMTMSVFERTAELGVLASLGTRPGRLLSMVLLESMWQAVLAFAVGVGLAAAVLQGMGTVDLSSMMQGDVMGTRLPSSVKLTLYPGSLTGAALTAFFTALLGGLLPALRAARLKPFEALRHT